MNQLKSIPIKTWLYIRDYLYRILITGRFFKHQARLMCYLKNQ